MLGVYGMGMPCEVNSILKLSPSQGYPSTLEIGSLHEGRKKDYRIIPIDVPIPLVDELWNAYADIIIRELTWNQGKTSVSFEVYRVYDEPVSIGREQS